MRYVYRPTFADFKQAQRTLVRSSVARRFRFHFFLWGLALLGVGFLFLFALTPRPEHAWIGTVEAGIVGGCIGGGLATALLRPWTLRRAYKTMSSGSREGAPVYLEVEDRVLRSGYEGTSEGVFQRAAICGSAEDEHILLLFLSKRIFLYLPKCHLPAEAFAEVHHWLSLPGGASTC